MSSITGTLLVSPYLFLGIVLVLVLATFTAFILLLLKQYKRCPPNRLVVIFGKTPGEENHTCKVIHGGAVFIWPLLQDYAYLCMEPMQFELPKELRGSSVGKGIKLPDIWAFAISDDSTIMQNAAIRLIGLPRQGIENLAADIVVGRIERNLHRIEKPLTPAESVDLLEVWVKEVDSDLANVGLVTLGYR